MGISRLALLFLPLAATAQAQAIKNEPPMRQFTEAEIADIAMPDLAFDPGEINPKDHEKYFIFHRPETSFNQAYADITECDALGSGINVYRGVDSGAIASAMTQYGVLAGGIGGAIGGMMADAIFGSAERRKARRINVRNCMYYKGYDRYALEKDLWQEFHFEEGFGRKEESKRNAALLQQARVASGPKPTWEVLEP
ncbi:hypothetical protein GRI94_07010 [Erythrobacter jejuensis]|uniref:Glycine zipper family protein n=2 Tax=Parerythrobacter jejuensis TaxID=795812 RepID=A0A845AXT2_9SPHN|nr:hypothetical protein [Parerythrobacter jejuensis]